MRTNRSNRSRRLIMAMAAILVAPLGLTAAADVQAQKVSGEPYKIGVTFPLSGPTGAWGQLLVPAVELAAQHANEAGGIHGRPVALVIEDTKGNPEGGIAAMRKVVQVDKVPAVLSIFTNVVSAQMPLAEQFKVAIVNTAETPGLAAKSEWTFSHSPSLNRTLPLIAARWKRDNVKRLFAFFPNTPLAKPSAALVKAEAARLGIEYDDTLFKLGDTDFRGLITRAKSFNPDAIFIFGHGTPEEGVIMKQTRELGMNTQLYNGCACVTVKSYREAAGKTAEGVIYAGIKYDTTAAKKLIDAYRAKVGFDPDYVTLEVYDTVLMVVDAIKKNGYTGDGIRRALADMKDFPSIGGGTVTMGKDRQSVPPIGLYQLKDSVKPVFVELKQ